MAGSAAQFKAVAAYSDGSSGDVSLTATWSSSNTAVATVNASGMVTAVAAGTAAITASMNGVSGKAALTVTAATTPKTLSSITVSPANASIAAGATQQFTAQAAYSDSTTADVSSQVIWSSANTSVATINASGLATGVAAGSASIQAAMGSADSGATLSVTAAASAAGVVNVTTWHFDNNRSGLNPNESTLTPASVKSGSFGKLFSLPVDGYVYGEPLLMSNLTINGAKHNVLYVATENDSVYAFDADSAGAPLWQVSLLQAGETPLTSGPIQPYEGVTSTPVIDASSNTIYVVSTQHSSAAGGTFRLNALDLATGAQKFGAPVAINASVPGTGNTAVNGTITLNTSCIQRAALLLANHTVYAGFGSCARGWLLAYDAQTLQPVGAFNSSPNLNGEGTYASAGGIWMGGGGPAADGSGNVYAVTGNGPWDGQTAWGDSVLKFNPTLQLLDYFTPQDYQYMDCADADLAAGGILLIPGTSEAVAGGKTGKLYLVNTTSMGHEQANDAGASQALYFEPDVSAPYQASCTDSLGAHTTSINAFEIFGTAAYLNGSVYLGITPTGASTPAGVRQFTYNGTLTAGPYTQPSAQQNTRGTTPFLSANGTSNGVVWIIDTGQPIQNSGGNAPTSATLRAYDAANFPAELYASSGADTPGYGIKFSSPVVANGKVYISTGHDLPGATNPKGEIDVYGLK